MGREVLFSSWQSGVNVGGEHGPQSFALNRLSLFQYKMFFQQFSMSLAVIYLARVKTRLTALILSRHIG